MREASLISVDPGPSFGQVSTTPDGVVISTEWLIITLITLGLGGVQWLFRREIANGERRVAAIEKRLDAEGIENAKLEQSIAQLERRLSDVHAELLSGYVTREDWVRFATMLETKLDALHRRLDQVMRDMQSNG
jgi:hypothetical protein